MPGHPFLEHQQGHVFPVGRVHIGDEPSPGVLGLDVYGDVLPEDESGEGLFRAVAERLLLLGGVYAPDTELQLEVVAVETREGVAVRYTYDPYSETLGAAQKGKDYKKY